MRVGTWNLERGGRSRGTARHQLEVLDSLNLDIAVITEPSTELAARRDAVFATALRQGRFGPESWVAVTAQDIQPLDIGIPYQRMAVAASVQCNGVHFLVYGSVLPWRSAPRHMPGLAMPDETYTAMFERILQEQEADMLRIRDAHPDMQLLWAGDFNQSLEGPNATGSRVGRTLVEACLTRLGMHAWNRNAPHAVDGLSAIDIICGPQDLSVREVLRIDPIQGGKHLSDHAGYVIDVDIA